MKALDPRAVPALLARSSNPVHVVKRDGMTLTLVKLHGGAHVQAVAKLGSSAAANRASELFHQLNIGDTPVARFRAAVQQADAMKHAAQRRMSGRPVGRQ